LDSATAETVDSELLLLVDASRSGLNDSEFSTVMEGYANSLTSSQVLDAIQRGAVGKIAVSMVFYGNSVQTVGIPWMTISSLADAQVFAAAARAAQRPTSATSSIIGGLAMATQTFGTETGAPDNGYTSAAQIIEVAASTQPQGGNPNVVNAQVRAARDASLAAGVDVINTLTLGRSAIRLAAYYNANVIGGSVGGVAAHTTPSGLSAGLPTIMATHLTSGIQGGAIASIQAIPEPKPVLSLLLLVGIQVLRARVRR
jgi:hypothetical protein